MRYPTEDLNKSHMVILLISNGLGVSFLRVDSAKCARLIDARARCKKGLKQVMPQRLAEAINRPNPVKVTPETFAAIQAPFSLDSQPLAAFASRA